MGLVRMAARTAVISGTATAVSGRVANRQAQRFAQAETAPVSQPVDPSAQSAPSDSSAKLVELANLHAQGVLTDQEFAAAKAKVLGL